MIKISILRIVFAGGLLLAGASCQEESKLQFEDCKPGDFAKTVTATKGTIWYDTQAQAYAIYCGIEGTYDSQDIGIVCGLSDDYKTEGVEVLFNGDYYTCDEFAPRIPGQTYYYLVLTEINPI